MSTALIVFILGAVFVVGGLLVAVTSAYLQERLFDRLAQRNDMRQFVSESRNNPSGPIRLGGLIAIIVGLGCWLVALILWLTSN